MSRKAVTRWMIWGGGIVMFGSLLLVFVVHSPILLAGYLGGVVSLIWGTSRAILDTPPPRRF